VTEDYAAPRRRGRPAGGDGAAGAPDGAGADPAPRPSPLYQQVKQHLVQRVLRGEWRPSELLPSEMKLAHEYSLSQGTVRKAIEEMAQEGLVSRQAGRGTFVTSHAGNYRPFRFHKLFSDSGQRIANEQVTFVHVRRQPVGQRAGAGLGLKPKAPGVECLRLRDLDDRPVLVEEIVLPERLFEGVATMLEEEKPPSIYLLLERHYNVLVTRVLERVRARIATEREADCLGLAAGTPVLEVERIAYSLGGEPVEWRIMVGETSRIHYASPMD
jgi:GntR family transcriptional regulator